MKNLFGQWSTECWCPSFGVVANLPGSFQLMLATCFYFVPIMLGFVAFNPGKAAAQGKCGDRTTIAKTLSNNYREAPVANGLTKDGVVIEVFASVSGSWTKILTLPTGGSCFLASGESWENLPVLTKGSII